MKFFFYQNCNSLIPRTLSRTSKLHEKPSALKIEHPALQKMKYYCFIFFWVILALLDPGTPLNPDPQHCQKLLEKNQHIYRRTLPEQICQEGDGCGNTTRNKVTRRVTQRYKNIDQKPENKRLAEFSTQLPKALTHS